MLNSRYSPLPSQAEITGKCLPDTHSFRQRANTEGREAFSYGALNEMLAIIPGEILVARRNCRNGAGHYGRSAQTVYSSNAGVLTDERSAEAMLREIVFVGFAKSEYMWEGDNLFGTNPLDHGLGCIISGSFSTINNSGYDINAYDILAMRLPPTGRGDPRSQGGARQPGQIDTGLNPVAVQQVGSPGGKPLFMIERYDPCDFRFQVAGCFDLFSKRKAQGGIQGFTLRDFFAPQARDTTRNMTSLQEEAFAFAWGTLVILAQGSDDPQGTARSYGLLSNDGTISADGLAALGSLWGRNTFPGANPGNEADREGRLDGNENDRWKYLTDHVFDLLLGGLSGAIAAKKARIVGTAISGAKFLQTLDVAVRI